jgi:chromosome partitioning protein
VNIKASASKALTGLRRAVRKLFKREPKVPADILPPEPAPEAEPGEGRIGRIIGVLNYKGGTGKTTTVVHLATGLAQRGKRVLCIDLDAQGGVARYLNVQFTRSLADLLLGEAEPQECIVQARENLDLIGSDKRLVQAERSMWRAGDQVQWALARRMAPVDAYDYVFLDYSPAATIVGECGLLYNREVIVPVTMDYMALVGTREVLETLDSLEETYGHHVELLFILPTFYDERQRLDREVIELLESHFPGQVAEPIRTNVKITEAPSHGMTIYEYDPKSAGAEDYARLVEKVAGSA